MEKLTANNSKMNINSKCSKEKLHVTVEKLSLQLRQIDEKYGLIVRERLSRMNRIDTK